MRHQSSEYRKFVSAAAAATLAASYVSPAGATSFTDVGDLYKEAVDYLLDQNLAAGITSTQFGTGQPIKRVDAAVILAKILHLDAAQAADSGFTDVPERAKMYVNALKAAGIINGKSKTIFASDQHITRGEFALIIQKAYNLAESSEKLSFTDVSMPYQKAVAALVGSGITKGKSTAVFGTSDSLTRGEFAIFLYKAEMKAPLAIINDLTVTAAAEGTAGITASVQGAADQTEARVDIVSNGKTAASKTVKVVNGKITADFTGLPAGPYTVKVTIGKAAAEKSFTVEARPAVTITNLSASGANGSASVTGKITNAEADAEVEVALYLNGHTDPVARTTVKTGDGNVKTDFTGLSAGTYRVKISIGAITNETSFTIASPPSSGGGVSYSDVQLLNMIGTHTRNLTISATGSSGIQYGPSTGTSTIKGNVTISGNAGSTIDLRNIVIQGDLLIDTPNATVNNGASVTGTITVKDVSRSTWNEKTSGNSLLFDDKDAQNEDTKLTVDSNTSVKSIDLNKSAWLELGAGATVGSLNNNSPGSKVSGQGRIITLSGSQSPELASDVAVDRNESAAAEAVVMNESQLQAALQNNHLAEVKLGQDIAASKNVELKTDKLLDGQEHTLFLNKVSEEPDASDGIYISGDNVAVQNLTVTTEDNNINKDNLIEVYGDGAAFANVEVTGGKKAGFYIENDSKGLMNVEFNSVTTSGNLENAAIGLAARASGDTISVKFDGENSFGEDIAVYTDGRAEELHSAYRITGLEGYYLHLVDGQYHWTNTPE
ncbi:S-layer homology domain-containing protein [Domibacillus indicus]|uniref:S-layer homology domain-containing protein n=1 Tax=Domibacillus indicus TaxID=1437523 RepID=UPI000697EA7B|nr:S-layer homology domain-containing protein [Domibacillus indicus]